MIKNLLFFSVFFITMSMANAQIELWLGPRIGVNLSNVSDMEGKSLSGLYAGAAFAVKFSPRYALQPELGFSMQGVNEFYDTNEKLKLNYFTIGLMNKLYLVEGFHVLVGPEFNFKINDTFSDWYEYNIETEEDYYYSESSDIQPFDFAIIGGLGYDLPFGLSFEARYKQGLLDISDFFNLDGESNSRLNQVFQIGLSYKFQLNK